MSETSIDPADNLPALLVGEWASEKHRLLREYVDASWGARAKYQDRCYTDLLCGPGRVAIRESGIYEDGSPLVAWKESAYHDTAKFTKIVLGDADSSFTRICETRLKSFNAPVVAQTGLAVDNASWACSQMTSGGLHLVFLDPFNLASIPFEVFRAFFSLRRVDFIVHFSANDLQRNLDSFLAKDSSTMDLFAPGWRNHVDFRARDHMRGSAFWYWVSLFEKEGFKIAAEKPLIRGGTNQPLYWLVNLSRNALAGKLWDSVADKNPQHKLF